jgi:imidazolonepropionase-like amidohydrolase
MLFDMGMGAEAILEAMMRSPLEPGAPADLIGVARNPFEDIDALRDLRMVMRSGRTVLQR